MSSASRQPAPFSDDAATRKALDHLFEEYERVRVEREALDVRIQRFADTIQTLLAALPESSRDEYRRKFLAAQTEPGSKAGETFNNVIWLVQKYPDQTWTVPAVCRALENEGKPPTASKAVSNAMLYLSRSGRLRRVGWGQYRITALGAGLETEEREDGTVRNSEHFV